MWYNKTLAHNMGHTSLHVKRVKWLGEGVNQHVALALNEVVDSCSTIPVMMDKVASDLVYAIGAVNQGVRPMADILRNGSVSAEVYDGISDSTLFSIGYRKDGLMIHPARKPIGRYSCLTFLKAYVSTLQRNGEKK